MNTHWLDLLAQEAQHTDALQWLVLILGVTEVVLARRNNIGLYPAGIAATLLALLGLFKAQLFAECLLHGYYLGMSVYGWWYWSDKRNRPAVSVTFATTSEWIQALLIIFAGWLLLYTVLTRFTPSTVPAWDAWVTSTAWAGTWFLARRKVENWLLLNVSNIFAIPLLFIKQLPLFALLTFILFVIACFGYVDWRKLAREPASQLNG